MSVIDEEVHKRYDFILRPIKDLAKNWEVDINHILEEYMGELEKIPSSTVDDGGSVVNFAEASLLIQGTACVWSRKVDYLHVLIKKSLGMTKQRAPGNSSIINDELCNEECQLLKLDDIPITSERLMTGKSDLVTRIPRPPPSMLEGNSDDRGRMIITEDKTDARYSNDFWENQFIPFYDKVSVLDRDAKGALHKTVVSCPQWHPETPPPIEQLSTPSEPDPRDDSVQDFNVTHPMEIEHSHEEIQDAAIASTAPLRPRLPNTTNKLSDDASARILDPYQKCIYSSWQNKKHRKMKSYRLPQSLSMKTQKRKRDGTVENQVETIDDFLTRRTREPVANHYRRNCLLPIMESEQQKRNVLWKSITDQAIAAEWQNVLDDDDENESIDCVSSDEYDENSSHSPNSNTVETLDTGAGNHPVLSYEDLVHIEMEKFYSSARRYKEENASAQRVNKWKEFVTPSLESQNHRPPFDIHRYGDAVLKQFSTAHESKLFEDVADSSDTSDICRLFAATLQLANDGNVSISSSSDVENSINTMELTLQNPRRCDRLNDYANQS